MKLIQLSPDDLVVSPELGRSGSSKLFEERLRASIEAIGLAEPIKVAALPRGEHLVVDGMMRLRAITAIRAADSAAFPTVPAYVVDYARRYEIRFQTDIYQDLLPSQLAALVEHLHKSEHVQKNEIARYIGVSPATLRNYTGLWRMLQRGGLLARLVELMDVDVMPASNPFAWLRLTAAGVRHVIEESFSQGVRAETWIDARVARARRGDVVPFPIKYVEAVTGALSPDYYREATEVRTLKRDLGLRRAAAVKATAGQDATKVNRHLTRVARESQEPVIKSAAMSLRTYLQ
jgi:ParB-like chromosome segregation protein Spo0J